MMSMQDTRDAIRTEIQTQVRNVVRVREVNGVDQGSGGTNTPEAPVALPPIPEGGGRLIVTERGDETAFTFTEVPPQLMPLARMAQETALGLMGLLAAIIILGPFARLLARRIDRRAEMKAAGASSLAVQQQLAQLQQSMDAMSVEVERIGESQRFQSKLLYEKRSADPLPR